MWVAVYRDKFRQAVIIGRWVFLGVLAVQVLAMVLAIVLRSITPDSYEKFEEEDYQHRRATTEYQVCWWSRGSKNMRCVPETYNCNVP